MSRDMIGDFLTVIRNAVVLGKPNIVVPHSVMRESLANILKNEGFVRDFSVEQEGLFKVLNVQLKYFNGESVIHEIKRISKPGKRIYSTSKSFEPVIGGLGISIVSTNKGVMTDKQAKSLSVGGEVICTVW